MCGGGGRRGPSWQEILLQNMIAQQNRDNEARAQEQQALTRREEERRAQEQQAQQRQQENTAREAPLAQQRFELELRNLALQNDTQQRALEREEAERQRVQEAAQRARQAEEQSRANAQAQAEQRLRNIDSAMNTTRTLAQQRLQGMGLNPATFADRIENELALTRARVPSTSDTPGEFFNPNFVDRLVDEERGTRRRNATAAVNSRLPTDFQSIFTDTADDAYIDEILNNQRTEATSALERAKARGNLTDVGFSRGVGRIDELGRAGRAMADTIGLGIINRFRDDASRTRARALERAGSIDISEPDFDVSPFENELNNLRNRFSSNLRGEVEGSLSNQSFFDIGDVLQRAGIAQGAQNPTVTGELSPAAVLAERRRREQEQAQRGIGGGGSF